MTNPPAPRAAGIAALTTAIIGTSFATLFYKLAFATGLAPLWVNALRLCLTLMMLVPFTLLGRKRRRTLFSVPRAGFLISALSGTLLALHFTAWALALQHTDAFAASALWGTYLLMTAALSSGILKEKTSRGAAVGMVIATAGVVVCNLGGSAGQLGGNLLALLAAFLQALYTLCGRKARETMDTGTYTLIVYSFTFFWMAVFALATRTPLTGFSMQSVLWALGLAVVCTLLGHSMLSVSLKFFKAPFVSAVMMVTVVTCPLMVFAFLGDLPSVNTFIGGCIIMLGLAWYLWAERRDAQAALAKQG